MALPYTMDPVSPFDIITSQAQNERIANIEALAAGSGLDDGAVTPAKRSGGFATGSSTFSASTGNEVITGVGFAPKKVQFTWSASDGTGGASNGSRGIGFGVMTSSAQNAVVFSVRTGVPSAYSNNNNDRCVFNVAFDTGSSSWTPRMVASFVSMDSDGFTVNKTTAVNATLVNWTAYG